MMPAPVTPAARVTGDRRRCRLPRCPPKDLRPPRCRPPP